LWLIFFLVVQLLISVFLAQAEHRQVVALVDFCATNNAKIPIIGAVFGVYRAKNRLKAGFGNLCAKRNKLPAAYRMWTFCT
jgi:hypothetical protein